MARSDRNRTPQLPEQAFAPIAGWWWLVAGPMLQAQRLQLHALLSWQQSIATFNRDTWEQWAVRYGGGVPLDG
jgi:hypothetical protein